MLTGGSGVFAKKADLSPALWIPRDAARRWSRHCCDRHYARVCTCGSQRIVGSRPERGSELSAVEARVEEDVALWEPDAVDVRLNAAPDESPLIVGGKSTGGSGEDDRAVSITRVPIRMLPAGVVGGIAVKRHNCCIHLETEGGTRDIGAIRSKPIDVRYVRL